MAKINKLATQLRLDEETYLKAKCIADREFRSLNSQLEFFIYLGIKQYEEDHGEIKIEE